MSTTPRSKSAMNLSAAKRTRDKNIAGATALMASAGIGSVLLAADKPSPVETLSPDRGRPNIVIILVDDMGWSDPGCYGGEIQTPNLDRLARDGVRFTQCYNTAKCSPSRACLLTGIYSQQCRNPDGRKFGHAVTLGEVLRPAGYRTLAAGKHHSFENLYHRGFDHYYGLRDGCCNYWNPGGQREGEPVPGSKNPRYWCDDAKTTKGYTPKDRNFYTTDAFTDRAIEWLDEPETLEKPFLLYMAYTAPHYPLHAWPDDIARYTGVYDQGYQAIQKARHRRQAAMGLIDPRLNPLPEHPSPDPWNELTGEDLAREKRRMEIYAAMVDRMDQNIGRLLDKLEAQGRLDNTLILFASDNGACAEDSGAKVRSRRLEDLGGIASFEEVGRNWATVQNTPLRFWKNYSHEGGIRTPLIAHWPGKLANVGGFCHEPIHLIDVMATVVDITGAPYPKTYADKPVPPMQGVSILPALKGQPLERSQPLFWKWSKGGAIREGDMKAVFWDSRWELYDLATDPNENHDLILKHPDQLEALKRRWQQWLDGTKAYRSQAGY